ncbi:LysR family transcriptional regulator [Vibrio breoganii]|uniref:LysR family transcriptional regulator n=1 Tax=Vibrio breoganii TaxID=553239 RepID=UPI000C83407E|nr:LysR family transcriptional regulator [Vibrio breoganii]PML37986.1 hypothetical protein BCT77_15055 [Vibrio breoganii]
MDYNLIKVFNSVCQTKSLTKAAEALNMTQPGISMALKKLREEVGVELYFRKGRGIELTSDGQWLHERFQKAEELLALGQSPELFRLYCTESLLYRLEGKIDAHFVESPLDDQQLFDDLFSRKIALVLDHLPRQSSALISEKIHSEKMVVVCREGHPRIGDVLTEEEYFSEQHIAIKMLRQNLSAFDYLAEQTVQERNVVTVTSSIASMMLIVSNSDRLGSVSESMFNRWGKALGLKCFDFPFPFKSVNYHITYHRRFINDLNHQRLRELIKQEVSL